MKSISNKQTEIKINDANANYGDLIRLVTGQPKQGGYDWTDQELRLAIFSALTKVTDEKLDYINLEDAQFAYLKKLVEGMKWNIIHADLLKFKEDIISIK